MALKAQGAYLVVCRANPRSYIVQKVPFLKREDHCGWKCKPKAEFMEKMLSTLCVHKKVDSTNMQFVVLE